MANIILYNFRKYEQDFCRLIRNEVNAGKRPEKHPILHGKLSISWPEELRSVDIRAENRKDFEHAVKILRLVSSRTAVPQFIITNHFGGPDIHLGQIFRDPPRKKRA